MSRKPVEEGIIKIWVLADLSGDYTSFLRGIPRGVEFAVEDSKKETDREIKLIIEDQKSCEAQETATIMNKFVGVDKVDVVIGGTCSNTTLAAAPIAEQAKTIMISPSSSAPPVSDAGEYVFRTYISDILRAREAAGLGGIIVIEEEITKKDTDFKTQLAKIKILNPDVLYPSITGPNQIALIAKQIRELGLNVQLIVPHETVENSNVIEIAGETIDGLIYTMPGNPPESPKYQELKRRYKEKYSEDEVPSYFTEAYDAVMLGVKAILASDGTKEDIKNKLHEVSKTYEGISGNVAFDENGDVTKPVMFKTIKNGQFVPYTE